MLRNLWSKTRSFFGTHPLLLLVGVVLLGFILWCAIPAAKERVDRWRFNKQDQKSEQVIKEEENKSERAQGAAEEAERQTAPEKESYENQRRTIQEQRSRVDAARENTNRAGRVDPPRPAQSDVDRCTRARKLGIRCDIY